MAGRDRGALKTRPISRYKWLNVLSISRNSDWKSWLTSNGFLPNIVLALISSNTTKLLHEFHGKEMKSVLPVVCKPREPHYVVDERSSGGIELRKTWLNEWPASNEPTEGQFAATGRSEKRPIGARTSALRFMKNFGIGRFGDLFCDNIMTIDDVCISWWNRMDEMGSSTRRRPFANKLTRNIPSIIREWNRTITYSGHW